MCQSEVVSVLNRRVGRHAPSVHVDLLVGSVCFTGEEKIHERKVALVKGDIGAFEKMMSVDIIQQIRGSVERPADKDAWSRSTLPVGPALKILALVAPSSTAPG